MKRLRMAARRKKVAELRAAGKTHKEMAEELGVATSTIINDVRAIKDDARLVRLEESLVTTNTDLVEAALKDDDPIRRAAIDAALNQDKTVREIAREVGATYKEVAQWVNEALAEIGDYGGRTLDQWRMQDLMILDERIKRMVQDSEQEPIPDLDASGKRIGWVVSPLKAAQIRANAGKVLVDLLHYRSKMLGLYQQKQEIKITRDAVVRIRGVDISSFPQLGDSSPPKDVIEGEFS